MKMKNTIIVLFFILLCLGGDAIQLKILMFQIAPSPSHLRFSAALTKILHENNHTVDLLVLMLNPSVSIIDAHRIRNIYRIEINDTENTFLKMKHFSNPFEMHDLLPTDNTMFLQASRKFCEAVVLNKQLLSKLKTENYNVMIMSPYVGCPFGIAYILDIKSTVGFVPTPSADLIPEHMGIPMPPSFVTGCLLSRGLVKLNFMERVANFLHLINNMLWQNPLLNDDIVLRKHYPNIPPIEQLVSQMTYLMLNTDEIIDIIKPISPKIKYIGGIAMDNQIKELNKDFETILNFPSKGVIVMSFGSLIKTDKFPLSKKIALIEAFSEFSDYTILWKYDTIEEDRELFINHTHIHLRKWLPQLPILSWTFKNFFYELSNKKEHPRVKVFISHMGQNSYYEASFAGIPTIGIPIFADQYYNSDVAVKNGASIKLDKVLLSKNAMIDALNEILHNPIYTKKAKDISLMIAQKPDHIGATEFMRFVKYAAEFPTLGPEILQIESSKLNFFQLYSYDVIAFLSICLVICILIIVILLKLMTQLMHSSIRLKIKTM